MSSLLPLSDSHLGVATNGRRLSVSRKAAISLAPFLSFLLAGQATAATWSPRIPVASAADTSFTQLITLGTTAIVAYSEQSDIDSEYYVLVRRSTDEGESWSSPVFSAFTWDSASGAVGGRGQYVDLVWDGEFGLAYSRSTDRGLTFSDPVYLDYAETCGTTSVSRGPGGVVAVLWHVYGVDDACATKVFVSKDRGLSWGKGRTLATHSGEGAAIAVGDGVIYAALGSEALKLRRSYDSGLTWTPKTTLATDYPWFGSVALVAEGNRAYIAYDSRAGIRVRRSVDSGASWSKPNPGLASGGPVLDIRNGVLRMAYTDHGVKYVTSHDGLSWTLPESVARGWARGVGYVGRPMVLFGSRADGGFATNLYVKTR